MALHHARQIPKPTPLPGALPVMPMARRSNALRQRLRCPYWRCCPGALPLLLNPRARTLTASNVIPVLRVHDVALL
ncbi:MAG: hypothetical protein RL462_463 [Pseudomonadota bacterium]|jgi:hypothetical protein